MDTPVCPTWCETAHDDDVHGLLIYVGPGPGGTCHVGLTQPAGEAISVQVTLERDASPDDEAPPHAECADYTAAAIRALADLSDLGGFAEFARALKEAASLTDRHQPRGVRVLNVPIPVPTTVWTRVLAADDAFLNRRRS
ncbi:hypothetical protein ACFVWN_01315 [Nocardiopsis flavescens]|uniref:hypothetical protein n=1 Tax=Nocardiopsis flavescens TaxID=758803 RepID=UPI00365BA030